MNIDEAIKILENNIQVDSEYLTMSVTIDVLEDLLKWLRELKRRKENWDKLFNFVNDHAATLFMFIPNIRQRTL